MTDEERSLMEPPRECYVDKTSAVALVALAMMLDGASEVTIAVPTRDQAERLYEAARALADSDS